LGEFCTLENTEEEISFSGEQNADSATKKNFEGLVEEEEGHFD
jgi:hypothetical protein